LQQYVSIVTGNPGQAQQPERRAHRRHVQVVNGDGDLAELPVVVARDKKEIETPTQQFFLSKNQDESFSGGLGGCRDARFFHPNSGRLRPMLGVEGLCMLPSSLPRIRQGPKSNLKGEVLTDTTSRLATGRESSRFHPRLSGGPATDHPKLFPEDWIRHLVTPHHPGHLEPLRTLLAMRAGGSGFCQTSSGNMNPPRSVPE